MSVYNRKYSTTASRKARNWLWIDNERVFLMYLLLFLSVSLFQWDYIINVLEPYNFPWGIYYHNVIEYIYLALFIKSFPLIHVILSATLRGKYWRFTPGFPCEKVVEKKHLLKMTVKQKLIWLQSQCWFQDITLPLIVGAEERLSWKANIKLLSLDKKQMMNWGITWYLQQLWLCLWALWNGTV